MARTARAEAMMGTLPAYYDGEPLVERIIQAWANQIDRVDALIDQLEVELQPGAATDDLGLLGVWERTLGLPVESPDATVGQRQAKVTAVLRKSGESRDTMATLEAAVGSPAFTVYRDTPDPLKDRLAIPYASGTYQAGVIAAIAARLWPAHRQLAILHSDGFILDVSQLDVDVLA